ncbi:MAG: zinc ribbon domain-containing protein [Corallococcus sp.]|nr:zinc ribbon domain-containing protein [Corallococcus sp.]
MNNSNSFNICTRCGTANSLSAKYCYQCGSQLKIPEEPVVCPKCHTVNSSISNFCRTCGTTLKVGAQTKICPRCKKEVPIEQNQCTCGYSFATVRYTEPMLPEEVAAAEGAVGENQRNFKGGRIVAVFSLIFLLLFSYLILGMANMKPEFLAPVSLLVDKGSSTPDAFVYVGTVDFLTAFLENMQAEGFTPDVFSITLLSLVGIFALSVVVHFVCAVIRLFRGKKQKGTNILYLILAILTTVATVLLVIANLEGSESLAMFHSDIYAVGYGLYLIPAFYWFFWLFSLFAKAKKVKAKKQ